MCSSTALFALFSWITTRVVVPYISGLTSRAVSDSLIWTDLCGAGSCERGYPVSQVSDSMQANLRHLQQSSAQCPGAMTSVPVLHPGLLSSYPLPPDALQRFLLLYAGPCSCSSSSFALSSFLWCTLLACLVSCLASCLFRSGAFLLGQPGGFTYMATSLSVSLMSSTINRLFTTIYLRVSLHF